MKLSAYLTARKISDEAFGKLVGLSQSQVSRIKRGASRPSWEAAHRIEAATRGKVKIADLAEKESA